MTNEAALALLRDNSREAAAAVRGFTHEELDHAAPFSLSFGAPVTAQFVIDDSRATALLTPPGADAQGAASVIAAEPSVTLNA